MRPYLDKAAPPVWATAQKFSLSVAQFATENGLQADEAELMKVRASQLNGCSFCLDLHSRDARKAGVPQQKLDVLNAWRETALYTERERAVLAVAEAATHMPITDDTDADLVAARKLLGEATFAAAEWVGIAINMFNRISILSEHPVRPRDDSGHPLH